MNILVTGASGFIGKNLVEKLLSEKHQVRVFLRKKIEYKNVEVFVGDLGREDDLIEGTSDIDVVYHLAAIRDKWGTPWQDYVKVNTTDTKKLLEASLKNKVKQFIYCSSVSVITEPFNKKFYGQSKILAEKEVNSFNKKGLDTTIIRPVITYGEGDDNGMITKLIKLISSEKYLTVGNGKNHVHLCYISDLVNGFILALGNKKTFGNAYVCAGPQSITINELVDIICKKLDKKIFPVHVPLFIAQIVAFIFELFYKLFHFKNEPMLGKNKILTMTVDRQFNIDNSKKDLGYEPKIDYEEGIEKTLEYIEIKQILEK